MVRVCVCEPLHKVAQPGDHVVIMSNGGFGGIHEKLLTALQLREARKASS